MVMLSLSRGFVEQGLSVDMVLASAKGVCPDRLPEGVKLIDLGAGRVLTCLPSLVAYLRKQRPTAMLSTLGHANIVALWACRLSGVPLRLAIRVATTPSAAIAQERGWAGRISPTLARRFYPWASGIIAVSDGVADDMARFYGLPRERIRVILNPIDCEEILTRAGEPVAHPWFRPGEPPVILGVGRLTAAKDYPTLLRAFALVRKDLVARLVVLGEGEERRRLEAMISRLHLERDVDLPGFVPNPIAFMAKAAVFVLPSIREGMPNALIQALGVCSRIVATDCPSGPREVLEGGRLGRLVPVGDAEAMAKAVVNSLTERGRLSSAGVLEKYSSSGIIGQYLQLLLEEQPHG
jgi:glycosyltransferase involved in cell wall biosynthesis